MTAKSEVELDKLICEMFKTDEVKKACYICNEDEPIPENCVVEKVKEIIQKSLTSERERIVEMFLRRLTNDHNEKLRWLRGIAFDEDEIIRTIVDLILTGGKP